MTPAEIERVFGRGRLRMTTGEHVEVFREEARDDEERRYTKRFLETANGDLRAWTEREWRILDRLGARGDAAVAKVIRLFPVDQSGMALYTPAQEANGKVLCTDACEAFWKPLVPGSGTPTAKSWRQQAS